MKRYILTAVAAVLCMSLLPAQTNSIPTIGSIAPKFTAPSTEGKINFPGDFGDSWKILFAHPKDFTPVCSSELLELAYARGEFQAMNVEFVVMSTDILEQHYSWKAALEEISYKDRDAVKIDFPLVADNDLKVSTLYGMIHSTANVSQNVRGVYILDPENVVRSIMFYPNEVGRNVDELKRTVTALQTTYADKNLVTPANWQSGDDVLVPVLTQAEKSALNSSDSQYYQESWFLTFKKSGE